MGKLKTKLQRDTVLVLQGHTDAVTAVAVTSDGTRAVSASHDMTLRIWDLATGKALATLQGHTKSLLAVAVTSDGTRAVSASHDMTLRIWDLATGKALAALEGNIDQIGRGAMAVTPDGTAPSGQPTTRLSASGTSPPARHSPPWKRLWERCGLWR